MNKYIKQLAEDIFIILFVITFIYSLWLVVGAAFKECIEYNTVTESNYK